MAKVAILMGSQSDMAIMQKAADVLTAFGVAYDFQVMSAHRTPEKVADYAKTAKEKGFRVIVAGAGLAAHLAGGLAAHTTLPIIGVPLNSGKGLGGMDALLATVQMPKGVPVATVAIDGAQNAAYLAIQILSLMDETLAEKFAVFKKNQ